MPDTAHPHRPWIPRLCGAIVLLLGLELIAGWLLRVEAMVRILPSSNSVSFNTAVAFVLCGAALLLAPRGMHGAWRRRIGAVLAAGASAILFENIFDVALGLDWELMHRVVRDLSPRPGRVAPNTCAALLLLAVMLFHSGQPDSARRRMVMPACSLLLVALVTTGITGLLLDPTLMYGWYKFNRMAAPTAFGLGLALLGLYAEYRTENQARPQTTRELGRTIVLTGAALLLASGMAGAITTAIIFANQQQQSIRDQLQTELQGSGQLTEVSIAQAAAEAGSLAGRPLLRRLIQRVGERHAAADVGLLEQTMAQLLQQGFSGLSIRWSDGSPPATVGGTDEAIELALPLSAPFGGELLWRRSGFAYRGRIDVSVASGSVVARLTTERPLPSLSSLYAASSYTAASAEVRICAPNEGGVACFPSRLHPTPFFVGPASQRPRLPVDDAIDGKTAVSTAQDYRGVTAVAAVGQIGNTGLVIVSKVDAVEIYQPIADLLWRSLGVLVVSSVVGVLLLRATVGPLTRTIARSEARAVKSERRLKAITDNVPALIGFLDQDLKYCFMNASYERWFGQPVTEMLGKTPRDLLSSAGFALAWPYMQRALAGEVVHFTYEPSGAGEGLPKHVSVSYIPDRGEDGRVLGFNVLAFDTTERHRHEQSLLHLAHHDSLTELPNRRLFEDRLQHAFARSQRHDEVLALLYLDIDHFKQINDTLGHEQGDRLLRSVAQRLTDAVRSSDTVARLGGDEFVVLMEGLKSREDALVVANKILMAFRMPFKLGSKPQHVSASIGVAYSTGMNDSTERLVQCADSALYEAKAAGRDRCAVAGEVLEMVA